MAAQNITTENTERALLASLLVDPAKISDVSRLVPVDAFDNRTHRAIFGEMASLSTFGGSPNPVTLADHLRGRIPNVEVVLCEIQEHFTTENIKSFIQDVNDSYRRRRLRDLFTSAAARIGTEDPELIRCEVKSALDNEKPASEWNSYELSPARFLTSEPPEWEFLVPGLLARGIIGFVYGEGGSYKSLAALWLVLQRSCASIHAGQKWLDRFEVTPGRSIFLSAEDVEADLHHRVKAIAGMIGETRIDLSTEAINREISQNCLIVPREQWTRDGELFIVNEAGATTGKHEKIIAISNEFGADLIVLETYSRIANVEEIDNRQAARVIGCLEEIRDRTGATVLVVAHVGKGGRTGQTDTHGQNALRGASALLDNSRFGLWFKAQERKDNTDRLEIVNSKSFRCKRTDRFKLAIEYPGFRLIEEDATEADLFDLVIEDVRQHPGTKQRETRDRLKAKQNATNQAFKDAVSEGVIYLKGPKNRPEGYFISNEE